jgi:hypothetical protein
LTARFGPRFGAESAFIVAVAVIAALFELSWPVVAAAVFAAWAIVAVVEILLATRPRRQLDEGEPEAVPAPSLDEPMLLPPPEPPPPLFLELPEDELDPAVAAPEPEPEPVAPPAVPLRPAPAPRPVSRPVTVPAPVRPRPAPALRPTATGQWNLWELEGRAREWAGLDPLRDEEWSFLLMYLREFADSDGMLPTDFDPLVRESFGELIGGDE